MGSNPSAEAVVHRSYTSQTGPRKSQHDFEKEREAAGAYDNSSDEGEEDITLDDKIIQRRDKILQDFGVVIQRLSKYKEHYNDHRVISQEYSLAARQLVTLQKSLANLSQDKRAKRKFAKDEGSKVVNSGGIAILCDVVVFFLQKNNDFQGFALESTDDITQGSWDIIRMLLMYLCSFVDRNRRLSEHFVSHASFFPYSVQVIRRILQQYSNDNNLVSFRSLGFMYLYAIYLKCLCTEY